MAIDLEQCVFSRAVLTWAARTSHNGFTWREHNYLMRDVIWNERRILGCEGKEQYPTFEAALRVVKHVRHAPMKAYACKVCRYFHIAHLEPDIRRAMKRLKEKRLQRADKAYA